MPSILNVLLISLFFFLIFGIIGINFYKGLFFYCNYDHMKSTNGFSEASLIDKWDCLNSGSEWLRYDSNFNSLGGALTVLFTIS